MILQPADLRLHVTTALENDALQHLLDSAEALIVKRAGQPGEQTEWFTGWTRYLGLSRPIDSIVSITETVGSTVTTLATDDYSVRGYLLFRERGGTNSRWHWHGRVAVTYKPVEDDAIRIGVQIDLCRLALSYNPGLTQQVIGTWSESYAANSVWNNEAELESILCRLDPEPSMIVVGGSW